MVPPHRLVQLVPKSSPSEALQQVARSLAGAFARAAGEIPPVLAADRGRDALEAELRGPGMGEVVLLHYVGYGYARRGAPSWLADRLAEWRRGPGSRRLLVHFHEVAANGPPWRSSFWVAPWQRRVAARLARMASGSVTSLERYARQLTRLAPATRVEVLPIFSAIGEPRAVTPWSARAPLLILIGSGSGRAQIWQRRAHAVALVARALGVERIVEIGAPAGGPERCGEVPVERTGVLESARVSEVLSRARVAFFDYPVEFLDKSSAFAAACAHGVLPVCAGARRGVGRVAGALDRWLPAEALQGAVERAEAVARSAREWYEGHDLERHARTWTRLLEA